MRLLLDTHALVWWMLSPHLLSPRACEAIENGASEVYVSAVSAIEIATKVRLGKFEDARALATRFAQQISAEGFDLLSITADHGERAGNYLSLHGDPWDRLLVAQAEIERLTLVSCDGKLNGAAQILW